MLDHLPPIVSRFKVLRISLTVVPRPWSRWFTIITSNGATRRSLEGQLLWLPHHQPDREHLAQDSFFDCHRTLTPAAGVALLLAAPLPSAPAGLPPASGAPPPSEAGAPAGLLAAAPAAPPSPPAFAADSFAAL